LKAPPKFVVLYEERDGFMLGIRGGTRAAITVKRQGNVAVAQGIYVIPPLRRKGVATRLYEQAAARACSRWGTPLASDTHRTAEAETFWKKQETKGRARCLPGRGVNYVQGRPGVETPVPCERYVLACPAPVSLAQSASHKRR
jgi:GNAT superfamily N-acetyltransferase